MYNTTHYLIACKVERLKKTASIFIFISMFSNLAIAHYFFCLRLCDWDIYRKNNALYVLVFTILNCQYMIMTKVENFD